MLQHTSQARSPHVKKYISIVPRKPSMSSPRSAVNHRMRHLDQDMVSPPSPVARTDFSQNPKTIGEIQRSLQYVRQWIRETEPVISSLQTGKDDTPELISMLANRFREKLREELLDKMQKDLLALEDVMNERIYKKNDEIRRDLRHLEEGNIREFKELDDEMMYLREQQNKQKQQFLKYQKEQIHEMNQLADATDGVKNLCETEIRALHEKLDAKFESTLKVVKDLKELFTKRYDFLSLETTNAINSLTEMTQKNLKVQSLKMDKMYAELSENIQKHHHDNLTAQEKFTQRFKTFRQKANERYDKVFEQQAEYKQHFESKLDDLHSVHGQMKKTQNNIIMRIDREASLSLSLQQHQRKQNLHMEEKIQDLERSAVLDDVWECIWSKVGEHIAEEVLMGHNSRHEKELRQTQEVITLVEQQLLGRIQESNDKMQQHLENEQTRQLEEIQEAFQQFCAQLEGSVHQHTSSMQTSLSSLTDNVEMVQVKDVVDDMVSFIVTNNHNAKLDSYLRENTNLLQLMHENQAHYESDISELIVHDVLGEVMRSAFDKVHEKELAMVFDTVRSNSGGSSSAAEPLEASPQMDPKWFDFVSDKLASLEKETSDALKSISALDESVKQKMDAVKQELEARVAAEKAALAEAAERQKQAEEETRLQSEEAERQKQAEEEVPQQSAEEPAPQARELSHEEQLMRQELESLQQEQDAVMQAMMELAS